MIMPLFNEASGASARNPGFQRPRRNRCAPCQRTPRREASARPLHTIRLPLLFASSYEALDGKKDFDVILGRSGTRDVRPNTPMWGCCTSEEGNKRILPSTVVSMQYNHCTSKNAGQVGVRKGGDPWCKQRFVPGNTFTRPAGSGHCSDPTVSKLLRLC